MASINGVLFFKNDSHSPDSYSVVKRMSNSMLCAGRGEDKIYHTPGVALGIRCADEGGCGEGSSFFDEKAGKAVAIDGEIYNCKDLIEGMQTVDRYSAISNSAQVILLGYERDGVSFFEKVEGAFSLAIVDLNTKQIVIARDKNGHKPLYYHIDDGCCVFSSELRGIVSSGMINKEIDRIALSQYFQLTYIPAPRSILCGVSKVMPATAMAVSFDGSCSQTEYWSLIADKKELIQDYGEAEKTLRRLFFESIERRVSGETSIGAFLSGGIDSTIVVGAAAQICSAPINTFTIGFDEKDYDESDLAAIVAKKHGTNHHTIVLDKKIFSDAVQCVTDSMDEPYADSSLIAAYVVSKRAGEHVRVALTGDAGDELFAGYNKYLIGYYNSLYSKIPRFVTKGIIKPIASLLPVRSHIARKINKFLAIANEDIYEQRKQLMSLGFKQREMQSLMLDGYVDDMRFIEEYYTEYANLDEQTRAQYIDYKVVLEGDMLPKSDKAGRMTSLIFRAPVLDCSIVDFAYSIPSRFKIDGKKRKIIWKQAFSDLIPSEILKAPKRGFSLPISKWLDEVLSDNIARFASRDFLEKQNLFSYEFINEMIDQHVKKKQNRASELWAFYIFQRWYEVFFLAN